MVHRFVVVGLLISALLFGTPAAQALPSLAAEDMIGDLRVSVDGQTELIPVLRDQSNRRLFYYAPVKPRLAEQNGKPVFKLLKFQRKKSNFSSEQ